MPRPKHCRFVGFWPGAMIFKPIGLPTDNCGEVVLHIDEWEALRLADYEGLYQEEAAARMGVSRQTFGRILQAARRTVAEALVKGLALRIEGGPVQMVETRIFRCADCGHRWEVPFGGGRPPGCPACQSQNFHRVGAGSGVSPGDAGYGHRRRWGCRQGRWRGAPASPASAPSPQPVSQREESASPVRSEEAGT